MLPPKLGLLSYVADAYLDGRSDDILLQPVSISFDQLHETTEYAAYARGGEKTPEGASWLYNFIKAQGDRNFGKIYVRFPNAVSMRQYLGEPHGEMASDEAAKRLAMQKMAFEVAWRILRVTPINATGLVSALLLTTNGVALTLSQVHHTAAGLAGLPGTQPHPDDRQRAAAAHPRGGPVGARRVVRWASGDPHRRWPRTGVAYRARERARGRVLPQHDHPRVPGDLDRRTRRWPMPTRADGDRLEAFWRQAMRLRDLLKFDFYFADSAAFREHLAEEMS